MGGEERREDKVLGHGLSWAGLSWAGGPSAEEFEGVGRGRRWEKRRRWLMGKGRSGGGSETETNVEGEAKSQGSL